MKKTMARWCCWGAAFIALIVLPPVAADSGNGDYETIVNTIYGWAAAWEKNVYSIDAYRSYYDRDFWSNYKAKEGMNYDQWMNDKNKKGRAATCIQVQVSDINVELQGDFAVARFMQRYVSNSYCDYGWKTLYLVRRGSSWKIIGEEQGKVTKCSERCSPYSGDQAAITSTIYGWAAAWEKNVYSIDAYRSYYDRDFWSNYKARNGMNYDQWMADKKQKGQAASCIRVQVSNISVEVEGDWATARFMQRYVSNSYCDYGWKTLYLVRRGSSWKIIGEEQGSVTKCSERCGR